MMKKSALNSCCKTFIVLLVLLLSACSPPPQKPLRLASSPWPGYEPLYLGRDLDIMDNDTIRLYELPSSDITMESFRNKSTDLATLTLDETLELLHDGVKLKILLVLDISHGGDAALAPASIPDLSAIKGKRIAIVNIPLGLYMLNRMLDKAGLHRNDVEVFPMSESKQFKFYQQGKADVVVTFEPVKSRLLDAGLHVIFDSTQIPNEIFDLLVVHEDVYQARRDDICRLVKDWYKTLNYIHDNKADAAQRITRRLRVATDEFDHVMGGIILPDAFRNRQLLGGDTPGILQASARLSDIMVREGQLSKAVSLTGSLDKSFANCHIE